MRKKCYIIFWATLVHDIYGQIQNLNCVWMIAIVFPPHEIQWATVTTPRALLGLKRSWD
jgi:hypothetical protein